MNLIFGVLGLYAISRLYSSVTGKNPSSRFNLAELKDAFQKNSGVWWFMVPISGILIMFFEAVVSVLWFLGELLHLGTALIKLIITILKWIYKEVILGGFYFLWKLIWHYLICIPWGWFREAFRLIGDASKWSSYKTASIGIFASLIIAFFGRYINSFMGDEHMTIQGFIQQATTLLSIIPIGMAASMIAFNRKNGNATWKAQGMNYAKIAAAILVPMIALIGIEYLLINVGSRTSFQFSLSTLLAGGSLFASFLILINSILIIFVISALPSFANAYSGDFKGVYRAFLSHLYYGWVSYLLAIPAIIIPAFILSIIPGLVTQGMTYITLQATDYVYEQRITSISEEAKESIVPYADWCNVDSISNDSLNKLIEADMRLLSVRVALNGVERGQAYLDSSYSSFANRNGAVTVGLLSYMYNSYADMINENLKAQPMNTGADSDSSFALTAKEFIAEVSEMDSTLARNNRSITAKEEEKAAVCVVAPIEEPMPLPQPPVVDQEPAPIVNMPVDGCELERQRIDGVISDIQTESDNIKQRKVRYLAVIQHLNKMQENANSMVGSEKVAKHLGYFFMSIWMCALAAIAMGFVLSIYSHLNSIVYDSIDNSDWLITSQIRDAHAANKNQPLLGLLLTFVTSLMLFGLVSNMDLSAPNAILEKAKSSSMKMFNQLSGITDSAPAPSAAANEVVTEIQAEEEQLEQTSESDMQDGDGMADAPIELYRIDSPQGYANLREIPDGMIIREVYPYELFTILGELEGFYGVELQDGTRGFIQSSLVTSANQ